MLILILFQTSTSVNSNVVSNCSVVKQSMPIITSAENNAKSTSSNTVPVTTTTIVSPSSSPIKSDAQKRHIQQSPVYSPAAPPTQQETQHSSFHHVPLTKDQL